MHWLNESLSSLFAIGTRIELELSNDERPETLDSLRRWVEPNEQV